MKRTTGFEPVASGLKVRRSTTELCALASGFRLQHTYFFVFFVPHCKEKSFISVPSLQQGVERYPLNKVMNVKLHAL